MTSLAMTLEALGKSAKDYKGPEVAMLPQIAHVLPERVATAVDRVPGEEEIAALRLPDFLQVLAISKFVRVDPALAGTDPKAFVQAVEKARNEAAGKITQSGWFQTLIGEFGVTVANESPFGKLKVPGSDVSWADAIERVGEINRGSLPDAYKAALAKKNKTQKGPLTEEEKAETYAATIAFFNSQQPGAVAEQEKRLAEVEESLKTATAKDKRALIKRRASSWGRSPRASATSGWPTG